MITTPPTPSGIAATSAPDDEIVGTPLEGQPAATAPERVSRWRRFAKYAYTPPGAGANADDCMPELRRVVSGQGETAGTSTPASSIRCAPMVLPPTIACIQVTPESVATNPTAHSRMDFPN